MKNYIWGLIGGRFGGHNVSFGGLSMGVKRQGLSF